MFSVMREFADPKRALVVTALSGSAALSFSTLKEELHGLLKRVFATL
jgi:RNase P protein component